MHKPLLQGLFVAKVLLNPAVNTCRFIIFITDVNY